MASSEFSILFYRYIYFNTNIQHLIIAFTAWNRFTTIGLNQTQNKFVAPKGNRFYVNHYDHAVTRYMKNSPYDDDPNSNPHLTEKFFMKSEYIFHLDSNNKKLDHIIDHAQKKH